MGVDLDIGTIPKYVSLDATGEDPDRAARLVAHAIARGADKVGLLRKISRHLEGNENKAGIGSDLIAAGVELFTRNQEQMEHLLREYSENVRAKGAARRAAGGGASRRGFRKRTRETPIPPVQGGETV